MKKLFALFLALMMIVCLAACGEARDAELATTKPPVLAAPAGDPGMGGMY